jgi:hypothetical protein
MAHEIRMPGRATDFNEEFTVIRALPARFQADELMG